VTFYFEILIIQITHKRVQSFVKIIFPGSSTILWPL